MQRIQITQDVTIYCAAVEDVTTAWRSRAGMSPVLRLQPALYSSRSGALVVNSVIHEKDTIVPYLAKSKTSPCVIWMQRIQITQDVSIYCAAVEDVTTAWRSRAGMSPDLRLKPT